MQNKRPKNEQGQAHGFWETYAVTYSSVDGEFRRPLYSKGIYVNGEQLGEWLLYMSTKVYYAR